jgi:hypothetical protein
MRYNTHSFPVKASFVRDTSPMRKLGEIYFISEHFKAGEEFLESRSI